ncbi:hypothetical protein N288_08865 [Bacillus infantis NRRL B-14911]|uniref:Uncharacterized protein n=1 Tax=Bacillus infantis NRRL B-14911 TaxID=1367477 RepID=U5L8J4_9BACI|nr:hypothetical protein N288_08865 [Bacillus infantis NRRL B-14911]
MRSSCISDNLIINIWPGAGRWQLEPGLYGGKRNDELGPY